jgi:hypothetical protein
MVFLEKTEKISGNPLKVPQKHPLYSKKALHYTP